MEFHKGGKDMKLIKFIPWGTTQHFVNWEANLFISLV